MTRFLRALAGAAAATLLAGGLAACGGGGGNGPVQPLGGTTTSTATGTPTDSATTSPEQQKAIDANAAVGSALAVLAAANRAILTDNGLVPAARRAVSEDLTSARNNLKATRAAAFGSYRSCSSVLSHAAATRAASARASSAASSVTRAVSRLRSDISRMDSASAVVRVRFAALTAALAGLTDPPPAVAKSDVDGALSAAATLRKETLASMSDATSKTAAAVSSARQQAYTASSIAAHAC